MFHRERVLAVVLRRDAPAQTPRTRRVDELLRDSRASLEALVRIQAGFPPRGNDLVEEIRRRDTDELEMPGVLASACVFL